MCDRSRSRDDDDRSRSRDRRRITLHNSNNNRATDYRGDRATDYRGNRAMDYHGNPDLGGRITIVWRYWDAGTGTRRDPTGRNLRVLPDMTVRQLQQEIALRQNHHPDRVDIYHPRFDPPRRLPWSSTIAGEGMREGQLLLVYLVPYGEACVRLSAQ